MRWRGGGGGSPRGGEGDRRAPPRRRPRAAAARAVPFSPGKFFSAPEAGETRHSPREWVGREVDLEQQRIDPRPEVMAGGPLGFGEPGHLGGVAEAGEV